MSEWLKEHAWKACVGFRPAHGVAHASQHTGTRRLAAHCPRPRCPHRIETPPHASQHRFRRPVRAAVPGRPQPEQILHCVPQLHRRPYRNPGAPPQSGPAACGASPSGRDRHGRSRALHWPEWRWGRPATTGHNNRCGWRRRTCHRAAGIRSTRVGFARRGAVARCGVDTMGV